MGMSLCTLGMSKELAPDNIAVNSLWPLTAIDTAAIRNVLGDDEMVKGCRLVSIMADAAYAILCRDAGSCTGNFYIDEEVLREEGVTDFEQYAVEAGATLFRDFFVPDNIADAMPTKTLSAY